MSLKSKTYKLGEQAAKEFWQKAKHFAYGQSGPFALLENHGEAYPYGPFPFVLAFGHTDLDRSSNLTTDVWQFGLLPYDYKNELHGLESLKPSLAVANQPAFFSPGQMVQWDRAKVVLLCQEPDALFAAISAWEIEKQIPKPFSYTRTQTTKYQHYKADIVTIKGEILAGNIYELNYCKPVVYEGVEIDGLATYHALIAASPMPFQFLFRLNGLEVIGSSPERFLKRMANKLVSQPIKGTAKRLPDLAADRAQKQAMRKDEKILAENMMITDLVRNDLMQICEVGSVQVEELFKIYSFKNLHQMITTVSGQLKASASLNDVWKATFPMGSMTGAPKLNAMRLIDQLEPYQRGAFSGAFGWKAPNQDFDFCVVIRSFFHNLNTSTLWYQTGGAIVWDSTPEDEWEEAKLKAQALAKVLAGKK